MKKKISTLLLIVLILLVATLAFTACDDEQYTITITGGDNAEYEQQTFSLKEGAEFTLPALQTELNHYVLVGYKIDDTLYKPGDVIKLSKNMTVTAVWELAKYDVTFIYGLDGEHSEVQNLEYGAMPTPPTVQDVVVSEALTKHFAGWDKEVVAVAGATTYTAQYTDINITVDITLNGGENSAYEQKLQTIAKGSNFTLPTLDGELNHYILIGWNDGETTHNPGAVVKVSANATFTAVWQLAKYDITFVYGLDGEHTDVQNLEYGATPTPPTVEDVIVNEALTKHFTGWDKEVVAVAGATTYTAQYGDINYTVDVTLNGGENSAYEQKSETIPKGNDFTLPTITGELNHFVLTGWSDGETTHEPGAVVKVSANTAFTAVWELAKYDVTFVYGLDGEHSEVQNLEYGAMPTPPTVQDVAIDERTAKTLDKWDSDVVAVEGDVTYTAIYKDADRIYTLSFEENEYVKFFTADGSEEITSLNGTFEQAVNFSVKKNAGVYALDMQIMLGDNALTAVDNVYSVTLTGDGLVVRQKGARFVSYEIGLSTKNVTYLEFAHENVPYGTVMKVYAKGNEWYGDNAPKLTYGGIEIAPSGKEIVEGVEYFAYEVFADKNADIVINGILDTIPITIIDIYGEKHVLQWTINNKNMFSDSCFDDSFDPMYEKFAYNDQILMVDYEYDSGWKYSAVLYTSDSSIESRILSKADYDAKLAELLKTQIYPTKGEANEYYLVYYILEEYYTGVTLPYTVTEVQYRTSTAEEWSTWTYTEEGPDNTAPHFSKWSEKFAKNTELFIRFTMPDGSFPTLYDVKTDEAYNAQTYTVGTEEVMCYRLLFVDRDIHLTTKFENLHIVSFENAESELYSVYNISGNEQNYAGINVQDGGIYSFYVSFENKLSDIMSNLSYDASTKVWSFKEGYNPVSILGSASVEYKLDYNGSSWSSPKVYVYLTNITSDVKVTVNCNERASADMAFTISADYDTYVNDVLLEGEVGQVVTAPIKVGSTIKLVVKKAGYQFEGRLLETGWDKDVQLVYYYIEKGASKKSTSYSGSVNDSLTEYVYEFDEYGIKDQFDTTKPTTFNHSKLVPIRANAQLNASKNQATDSAGVSFPNVTMGTNESGVSFGKTGMPLCMPLNVNFSFDVTVQYGQIPVIYIELLDTLSDGYLPYRPASVVQNGSLSTFTFNISGIHSDLNWYIVLDAEKYDVTFVYGEESSTKTLPYGMALSDVTGITMSFNGEKDGVPGIYTIVGWSTVLGGEEDILLVDGAKTLYAVTEFTPAVAVYNDVYYTKLGDVFSILDENSTGNIDLVFSKDNTPTLNAGIYNLPKGVTLRLPYALNAYGRKLADNGTDKPSIFYADNSRGTIALHLSAGVTLNIYGTISVGGIVGYNQSAYPYQGQTSADFAILQLDGTLNVQNGGVLEVNGYIQGEGQVNLLSGGVSKLPFIVKDYRGGTNSSNVYSAGYPPFNIYEMPNIQTDYYIFYGANEYAYAMLVALSGYNETEVCAIGSEGMIRLYEGGYVHKKSTQIANPRYSDATKGYEPQYEFRTTLDIYGGGTDGSLSLRVGFITVGMEDLVMAIPYTYSNITLHDGSYEIYNMFKIMPGSTLTVASDATLTVRKATVDGKDKIGGIIIYEDTFKEDHGSIPTFAVNNKQLIYPSQPNGVQEGGKLVVNGVLVLEGKFGGDITSTEVGGQIKVKSLAMHLTFTAGDAVQPKDTPFTITYEQTSQATVNDKATVLESNKIYRSYEDENGNIVWR